MRFAGLSPVLPATVCRTVWYGEGTSIERPIGAAPRVNTPPHRFIRGVPRLPCGKSSGK